MDAPPSFDPGIFLREMAPLDETDQRICEIAIELFGKHGVRRTSADDIAAKARINRTTLYRRLGSKDQIIQTAIAYEARRMVTVLDAETNGIVDPVQRISEGFAILISQIRDHPAFSRLIDDDYDGMLTQLTVDGGPLLTFATMFLAEKLQQAWAEFGNTCLGRDEAMTRSAMVVRLVHSITLIRTAPPFIDTLDDARDYAHQYLRPILLPRMVA